MRTFATNAAVWTLFCVVQLAVLTSGPRPPPPDGIYYLILYNVPFALYCWGQLMRFSKPGLKLTSARALGYELLLASLVFYVPFSLYMPPLRPLLMGKLAWGDWEALYKAYANYQYVNLVLEYMMFVGFFGALYAFQLRYQHQRQAARREAAEKENLQLRLELEQQRMAALQAQLEPHFMFNALNAISALVRSENRKLALTALSQLSALLRYALLASQRHAVLVQEELGFVQDYLALQDLRFSSRLCVTITVEDKAINDCHIPPLLLQPLIENVVRHDLEKHGERSEAQVRFYLQGEELHITISNPLHASLPENPGTGLGLKSTRDRLQLLYGARAGMEALPRNGRFEVHLYLPVELHEQG